MDAAPGGSGWTPDLKGVSIPDAPVSGRIHGVPFKVDEVRLEGAALNFRQGGDFFPDREFRIILFESDPAALNGRTIVVPNDTVRAVTPHVLMQWKEAGQELPKMEPSDKYVMRLEFEKLTGNKLQGRIYLCVFDREESFVRGKFEANLP